MEGASITEFGDTFYPDGKFYRGLNVFGPNIANISGGSVDSVFSYDASQVNISGGSVDSVYARVASAINISGGSVNSVGSLRGATGVVNISGGTAKYINPSAESTFNISGGTFDFVYSSGHSIVNISGGAFNVVDGHDFSTVNITGRSMKNVSGQSPGTLTISGGDIGGIDTDLNDDIQIGVYLYRGPSLELGAITLQGSGFALTNTYVGYSGSEKGTYSLLKGTLSDSTSLNTTLFLADGVTIEGQGATQDFPLLPDNINGGIFAFNGVPSGAWFDPPAVGAFEFAMTGGDFFTSILDFPSGIGDADGLFTVSVGGVALGQFSSGTAVNFADFGFAGGVSGFTVSGIEPTVDGGNATAFPIKLGFSSAFASFTMTGITGAAAAPEPGSLVLFGLALPLAGLVAWRRRGWR